MKTRIVITAVAAVVGAVTLSLLTLLTPIAALGAAPPFTVCPNLPGPAPSASPTAGTEPFIACPSAAPTGQVATTNHSTSGQGSHGTATTSGGAGSANGSPSTAASGNPGGSSDRGLVSLPEFGIGQVGVSGLGSRNGSPVGFLAFGGFTLLSLILLLVALAVLVNRHRLNAMAFRLRHAVGA